MNEKKIKIVFWGTTIVFSLMMIMSAFMYLTDKSMNEAFLHLGFQPYFRIELAFAKILGAIVLLAPLSSKLKEWAYAGFFITLSSAVIAHYSSGDEIGKIIAPLIISIILMTSYFSYQKLEKNKI